MNNETARIESFSDGVFAVAITLLIFQIRADWCLTLSALYALYFALPPSLWRRGARSA